MRFKDLEIVDLNGEEEIVVDFPSDSPENESKTEQTKEEEFDWKKEIKIYFPFTSSKYVL